MNGGNTFHPEHHERIISQLKIRNLAVGEMENGNTEECLTLLTC